jgi:formimidoylglutamate deiminase
MENMHLAPTEIATHHIFADAALLRTSWARSVRISIGDGKIIAISVDASPQSGDERCAVLIPGLANVHSHAFQRGMAGLAEVRGPGRDSFWSWRKTMYSFALTLNPQQMEAIAAQLYVEMLESGFTRVGEFHYLHNDISGEPYAARSELAQRIMAAASDTGLSLTLLPVFYAHAGFGGLKPLDEQRRFVQSLGSFDKLVAECREHIGSVPGGKLGVAPHSLRAVTRDELNEILPLAQGGPVHIHIAEQQREVEECVSVLGVRPVNWLMENASVNADWTFIHATHTLHSEISKMVQSGVTAGLCPITEANLGDGIFSASEFLDRSGSFGIGSDSNIIISPAAELRQLEYTQRLRLQSRNVIANPGESTGQRLFNEVLRGGAKSLHGTKGLDIGEPADLVAFDVSEHPYFTTETILDQWIFAQGVRIDGVWVHGIKLVDQGRHVRRDLIAQRFRAVMKDVMEKLS